VKLPNIRIALGANVNERRKVKRHESSFLPGWPSLDELADEILSRPERTSRRAIHTRRAFFTEDELREQRDRHEIVCPTNRIEQLGYSDSGRLIAGIDFAGDRGDEE
jgi:hypothetical protein